MLDLDYTPHDATARRYGELNEKLVPTSSRWNPDQNLAPLWRLDKRARVFKRLVDIGISISGLIVLSVWMPLLILAIRIESPGPILFRQRRIGLNGTSFTLMKFRTMRSIPATDELQQVQRDDPRVTRVGRWMRRYSVDELPQLLNVLRGEMSIVGPRPHAPGTRAGGTLFEEVSRHYVARHCVKPGMTGLAQVRGWRGETDTEDKLLSRIDSDFEYIATWSPALDLAIICRTIGAMLGGRNAY